VIQIARSARQHGAELVVWIRKLVKNRSSLRRKAQAMETKSSAVDDATRRKMNRTGILLFGLIVFIAFGTAWSIIHRAGLLSYLAWRAGL
jgi:hypothetical protein